MPQNGKFLGNALCGEYGYSRGEVRAQLSSVNTSRRYRSH